MYRFALLALLVVACKSPTPGVECADQTGAGVNGDISTTEVGGSCEEIDAGTKPGDPCTSGADCTPACCACPGAGASGGSASVGYCVGSSKDHAGVCATEQEACCTFDQLESTSDAGSCQ